MSGHAGIVTVHDAGILPDDRPYLIMDLCPGGSLTRWLPETDRRTPSQVREVGVRIADALAAAHARGVLHRDVKPANIMIDAYGHAGLADFGLAALPDPGLELSETVEAITPAYAPPEAFRKEPPTEFGDVYSLAATLYALLRGQSPHPTEDTAGQTMSVDRLVARRSEPIAPIPGVDPAFMTLLLDAMAERPADRPTAAQFRDRLEALDLDPPGQTGSETRHRRGPVLLVVAALLVVSLITAIIALQLAARNGAPVAGQPANGTAIPADPSANPTPTPLFPVGLPTSTDCSGAWGGTTFCVTGAECWAGVIGVTDVPIVANPQGCQQTHVYQTFAAGILGKEVRRQSQLEATPQVRKVCRVSTVNAMLDKKDRRPDWEIIPVGPQGPDDNFYRCLFGKGDTKKIYKLTAVS